LKSLYPNAIPTKVIDNKAMLY